MTSPRLCLLHHLVVVYVAVCVPLAVSKVYSSFCRWDDKSALENNSSLLTVLKQEQHAQMHGRTTGKIRNASGPRSKLPNDVLNWLAAEDDVYSSNSSSDRGEVRFGSDMVYVFGVDMVSATWRVQFQSRVFGCSILSLKS